MELRDKVSEWTPKEQITSINNKKDAIDQGVMEEDAISALINLGYKSQAAKDAIDRVISEGGENKSLDVILKKALKVLAM